MDSRFIIALTVLALVALAVEYYTRLFSRGHRRAFRPRRGRSARLAMADGSLLTMTVLPAPPPPERTRPPLAEDAGESGAEATGRERSADGLLELVRDLEGLRAACAPGEDSSPLKNAVARIESQLLRYDLDALMDVPDEDVVTEVMAYYRSVTGTLDAARKHVLHSFGPHDPATDGERNFIRNAVDSAIDQGIRLAHRLRGDSGRSAGAVRRDAYA